LIKCENASGGLEKWGRSGSGIITDATVFGKIFWANARRKNPKFAASIEFT